ncbi:MAG: GAF domain-containing protein [Bacillota bacterium]|nr:GAF domain-containing protein [Bacillota bacterium]
MDYEQILSRIEEENKQRFLSTKIFRYSGIIKAIEFFSQKLSFDQIVEAAFDFTNELLTVERSAIFAISGNSFVLKNIKGEGNEITKIDNTPELQNLPKYYGYLLYDDKLSKYFDETILKVYNVAMVIPLIIDDMLFGFIFVSNKTMGQLESEDYSISEALMKLFNNALENYKRFEDLQDMNRELDEKVFNLFAINQSSKALLSELNLNSLYNLSIDVFSELTQSSITGFVLYDELSEDYKLKAFKDIYFKEADIIIGLNSNEKASIDLGRVILNMEDNADIDYFNSLFIEGLCAIKFLRSKYLVLILKYNKVLGFVSLGPTTTGTPYKKSIFELTESLASAAYIALSNAQLFKKVNDQKKLLENKLADLISLNRLMKNINSAVDINTLFDLTLKTLSVSFNVEKVILTLYDEGKKVFKIQKSLNVKTSKKEIKPNRYWKKVFEGDTIYEAQEIATAKYINKAMMDELGKCSGILIIPIFLEKLEIEILGALIVFKYKDSLICDDEYMLTLETVTGHIAPVISCLKNTEKLKKITQPDFNLMLKMDLEMEILEAQNLFIDLNVIYFKDKNFTSLFENNKIIDKIKEKFSKVYPVTNNDIFIITNDSWDDINEKISQLKATSAVETQIFTFGKHFKSYKQFIGCIE